MKKRDWDLGFGLPAAPARPRRWIRLEDWPADLAVDKRSELAAWRAAAAARVAMAFSGEKERDEQMNQVL